MATNKMTIADSYRYDFSFTQNDVQNFAMASGDFNPIHLDDNYARNTVFKRRILHGFLGGSIFSKVFGTLFPGNGTIYLKQSMIFYKPMFTDVNYTAFFEVIDVMKDKNRALVKTEIKDSNEQLIIGGEALIQHDAIR
jgi:3-hydroxybutyryl-CoA dehydratase